MTRTDIEEHVAVERCGARCLHCQARCERRADHEHGLLHEHRCGEFHTWAPAIGALPYKDN